MNSERLLDGNGDSVGLFRSAFQSAIGHLEQQGIGPLDVTREDFLVRVADEKKKREWYFENDGVTQNDLSHYEEVMLDYLSSLNQCLGDRQSHQSVESCLHMLFR